MKSFAQEAPPSFTIPSGKAFPRAPASRELFYLEADLPDVDANMHVTNPWYARGAYFYTGLNWQRLTDGGREIKSALIPSVLFEVESIGNPMLQPSANDGFKLATLLIRPSHRKAKFSGTMSAWVDVSKNAHVWFSVFRDKKLIGVALEFVQAGCPRTVSLSFVDCPFIPTHAEAEYVLTMNSDVTKSIGFDFGMVYVNRSRLYTFDGVSQTAFTLSENT